MLVNEAQFKSASLNLVNKIEKAIPNNKRLACNSIPQQLLVAILPLKTRTTNLPEAA